jgi:TonB dependent receptor-like, beta-barrel/Carboxypeptidase regulatory-like domain
MRSRIFAYPYSTTLTEEERDMYKILVVLCAILLIAGNSFAQSLPSGTTDGNNNSKLTPASDKGQINQENDPIGGEEGIADEPKDAPAPGAERTQFRVTVYDADENVPIELARIALSQNGRYVTDAVTNPAGQARFRDIESGTYRITAWFVGYNTFVDTIAIDPAHTTYKIGLHVVKNSQKEVVVVGEREPAVSNINPVTGNQVFEAETYHAPPTARMTTLIQQNLAGAARAPTGEVHIRGQHGEYTFYVDGVPIPLGVFGGLNEVVDPKVIDRITFIDGGWPAEYGGQMSAIINLSNRVPTGEFHLDASTYGGSYLTPADTLGSKVGELKAVNSNGQALSMSDHLGKLGFFISGSRQETDRRIDTPTPDIFHDHGFDYFTYGKFDYVFDDNDYLTANLNFGKTNTQVPYDSVEGIAPDQQVTSNEFQTLSYYHTISSEIDHESNLFIGAYAREGGLLYTPGSIDPPNFQFAGDTVDNYLLTENRSFTTIGIRQTFDQRLSHQFMYKAGINFSSTSGKEDFTSRDSMLNPGPTVLTNFTGSDFGIFAETEIHPLEWTSFEIGARYDQHISPDAPLQSQVSPRIRWNFLMGEFDNAYLYYGRLFMPTNIEGLRTIATNVSNTLVPTLPERDNFYEAVYVHTFQFGLESKLAYFNKDGKPGIDDETVGNSAIKTSVNIQEVKTQGIEMGLSYRMPETPFSGYLNGALTHAYGLGLVSGGFLPYDTDGDGTDLDHDQRLSISTGLNYQPQDWFVNLVGIYGSGLSNGNDDAVYKTGLFDFNTDAHTTPSWIFNIGAGFTYHLDGTSTLEPSLYIGNIFDHEHLIKGAYFSGASWEEPRNVVFKVAVHI